MYPILVFCSVAATVLAVLAVIVVVVLGHGSFWSITGAVAVGTLLALLISWLIVREGD
jgi:hypothetical protein